MSAELRTRNLHSVADGYGERRPAGRIDYCFARFRQMLLQGLFVAMLALGSYWLISRFFLASVQIVGASMMPTLHDSERLLLNRWIYYLRRPHTGEIVVFRDPVDRGKAVKRIIAAPGDSVDLREGRVFVNGRQLAENYLEAGMPTFPHMGRLEQTFTCGKDQYLLLGDNRQNSADSRAYGLVRRQEILGLIVH
jgi:signal peptidase I